MRPESSSAPVCHSAYLCECVWVCGCVWVCVHVVGTGREGMHQSNSQVLGGAVFPQKHMFKF